MSNPNADYLNFKSEFLRAGKSLKERVENPHFYYIFALERLEEIGNIKTICDVGSADGVFLALARRKGFKAEGVEISPQARRDCELELGIKVREKIEDFEEDFDAVVLLEVLEHVDNAEEFLETCWKKTKRVLIFTVPIKDALKDPFHKRIFNFYDVFNLCSKLSRNFRIFFINKWERFGNPLNLFGAVVLKD